MLSPLPLAGNQQTNTNPKGTIVDRARFGKPSKVGKPPADEPAVSMNLGGGPLTGDISLLERGCVCFFIRQV